jgi:fructose-1,6-bisphosphatase I
MNNSSQKSLNAFLFEQNVQPELRHLIVDIARAGKYVSHSLKTGDLGLAGTSNLYGEDQLSLDVLADEIFCRNLSESNLVAAFASEERREIVIIEGERGKFSVAFDPLDGSSLVSSNISIGSIFGIWHGYGFEGRKGTDIVAAGFLVYGPRTTMILATNGRVDEFVLNDVGEFHILSERLFIAPDTKTFSPGNLRAIPERPEYNRVLQKWIFEGKTLRYTGGMVPDVNSILAKGNGVFTYPSFSQYPEGKLRLIYECAPMAFIAVSAGGSAINEKGIPILDIECRTPHDRTSIFLGSTNEVQTVLEIFQEKEEK